MMVEPASQRTILFYNILNLPKTLSCQHKKFIYSCHKLNTKSKLWLVISSRQRGRVVKVPD